MSDLIDPTCRAKRFLSAEQKCEIWSKDPHRGVDHQRGGGATSGGQAPTGVATTMAPAPARVPHTTAAGTGEA